MALALVLYPFWVAALLGTLALNDNLQMQRQVQDQLSLVDPPVGSQWELAGTGKEIELGPYSDLMLYALVAGNEATSRVIGAQPGQRYHYIFEVDNGRTPGDKPAQVQVRLLWTDGALHPSAS